MFKKDVPYGYIMQLLSPNLLNKGWPDKAKDRYKTLDANNRVKLLEDTMAIAFGIDDKHFFSTRSDKLPHSHELTHIWVWNMEEECPYRGSI